MGKERRLSRSFLFRQAGCARRSAILGSPLFFGVAHLHHLRRHVLEGAPLAQALAITGFQLVYTTLFGAFAAFVFARSGSLAAATAAHTFCNFMGLPDLGFLQEPPPDAV